MDVPTIEDLKAMMGALIESQRKTNRQIEETGRQIKETDRQLKETDSQIKETDSQLKETNQQLKDMRLQFKEELQTRDRQFKEELQTRDRQFKEELQAKDRQFNEQLEKDKREFKKELKHNDRQLRRSIKEISDSVGRMAEHAVAPALKRILTTKGITVQHISQRVKAHKEHGTMEIDVLVVNSGIVLACEVKNRLQTSDIETFVKQLHSFYYFFPEYTEYQLQGAVAGMSIDEDAIGYAKKHGLYILAQSGSNMKCLNESDFIPKNYR